MLDVLRPVERKHCSSTERRAVGACSAYGGGGCSAEQDEEEGEEMDDDEELANGVDVLDASVPLGQGDKMPDKANSSVGSKRRSTALAWRSTHALSASNPHHVFSCTRPSVRCEEADDVEADAKAAGDGSRRCRVVHLCQKHAEGVGWLRDRAQRGSLGALDIERQKVNVCGAEVLGDQLGQRSAWN